MLEQALERGSDTWILEKFQEESSREQAFQALVSKFQQALYRHIRRMVIDHNDTDDLLQNVFIKVWNNLSSFRADSQLKTWLYRIATNECLTFLRKKKTRFFLPIVDVERQLSDKLDQGELMSGDEIQKQLQKAILKLPEKQRVVFHMKYFDEMSYEEISEVLQTSVGALKASYHHAVKKVETYFEGLK